MVRRMIALALQGREFDLVVVRYLLLGLYVRPCVSAPFILDADDLSKRHAAASAPLFRRTLAMCRKAARDTVARLQLPRYAHVWFVNRADMAAFKAPACSLLPNIADEVPSSPRPAMQARAPTLLFVGNLEYGPNIHAVDYFLLHGWPAVRRRLSGVTLRIVGKRREADAARWNALDRVESLGFVVDLAAEYNQAAVVIAPVHSGGGTQIKVLEALTHGCAAVVSDFVGAGFAPELQDGLHFVVAKTPDAWGALCVQLIENPARAASIGEAGRQAVRQHFSEERVARSVEETITSLWPGPGPGPAVHTGRHSFR
jgi:glycosyltransferase involved in cell wall biosynthesis